VGKFETIGAKGVGEDNLGTSGDVLAVDFCYQFGVGEIK